MKYEDFDKAKKIINKLEGLNIFLEALKTANDVKSITVSLNIARNKVTESFVTCVLDINDKSFLKITQSIERSVALLQTEFKKL